MQDITLTNMKTPSKSFFLAAGPLFLVLFLDGMGLGLVMPIFNALIMDPTSGFISHTMTVEMRNFVFGITIGIFMLCWFFGAAYLGDLSDQVGRKKSLLICLAGAGISYLLSAVAVSMTSISLLILGRIIAGLTSGSQPIAQAAIVDLSNDANKARNIGLILFSLSMGFIIGPLLGGVLSDHNLVSWFNFNVPFYFAALLSLINIVLLWYLFQETRDVKNKLQIKWHHAVSILISAFTRVEVRDLSIVYLIFILGWSSFYSFIAMFLFKLYGFGALQTGIFMAVMGIGFGIGNGFLVSFLTKRFSLKANTIYNSIIAAIIVILMLVINKSLAVWLLIIPLACAVAVAYSTILTLFSNQVDADSQGWIMGISGAIMAFVWGIDSILGSFLANLNVHLPIVFSAVGFLISALALIFLKRKLHNSH